MFQEAAGWERPQWYEHNAALGAGRDMTFEHDPWEAGLGFAVKLGKGEFTRCCAAATASAAS